MRYAMDAICDLALTVRSEGIMDGGDLIGNRHIGAIASEGSGDAICDIADNWSRDIIKQSLKERRVRRTLIAHRSSGGSD